MCSCFTKIKLPLISEIKVDKNKLFANFKNLKNIGNFKMLKCIRLLFDKNYFFKNSANYLFIILFIMRIVSIIFVIFYNKIDIKKKLIEFSINKDDIITINDNSDINKIITNGENQINIKNKIFSDNIENIENNNEKGDNLNLKGKINDLEKNIEFNNINNDNIYNNTINNQIKIPKKKKMKRKRKIKKKQFKLKTIIKIRILLIMKLLIMTKK